MLALKPYWGKLNVRNFRGGDGNVGIIEARLAPLPYPTALALDVGRALSLLQEQGGKGMTLNRPGFTGERLLDSCCRS